MNKYVVWVSEPTEYVITAETQKDAEVQAFNLHTGGHVSMEGYNIESQLYETDEASEEEEENLSIWVDEQRQAYKDGKLTPEQIQKLESINGWTW